MKKTLIFAILILLTSCMSIKSEVAMMKHRKRTKQQTEWLKTQGSKRMTKKQAHKTSKYVKLRPPRKNSKGLHVKN